MPIVVSKEARVHLDTNTYSVPHSLVGRTVTLRADNTTVRVVDAGVTVAKHPRSWDRRRAIEDEAHIDAMLQRRPSARGPRQHDRIKALSPEAGMYLSEISRRKIRLDHEIRKLLRLLDLYGEADLIRGIAQALTQRTFGARYVRALIDQARFAEGSPEPSEPIITGNAAADAADVKPHDLGDYDALF